VQTFTLPPIDHCIIPDEFSVFTGDINAIEVVEAQTSPREILTRLAAGASILLTGEYRYIDAVYRYCQHHERELVGADTVKSVTDPFQRLAALTRERRRKLHHLLVAVRGDTLLQVTDAPETRGLGAWLQESTGDQTFLIPVRRLQRILTDMRRAHEGLTIDGLEGKITIRPHVYVPADASVPRMLFAYQHLLTGKRALDMGTGTGVLALLAAQFGASHVVATDINPHAVDNAHENVNRFGVGDKVIVKNAANLFDAVQGERFDVILFNAPWVEGQPRTIYDRALFDPGYRVLTQFLTDAPEHLVEGGAILLQFSDASALRGRGSGETGLSTLYRTIEANRLRIVSQETITRRSRAIGSQERVFLFEIRLNEMERE